MNKDQSPNSGKMKHVPGAVGQAGTKRKSEGDEMLARTHKNYNPNKLTPADLVDDATNSYSPVMQPAAPVADGEPKAKRTRSKAKKGKGKNKSKVKVVVDTGAGADAQPEAKTELDGEDDNIPICPCVIL